VDDASTDAESAHEADGVTEPPPEVTPTPVHPHALIPRPAQTEQRRPQSPTPRPTHTISGNSSQGGRSSRESGGRAEREMFERRRLCHACVRLSEAVAECGMSSSCSALRLFILQSPLLH